ncbi:MAG: hypothetical protein JWP76_5945 [Dactylosporangium sp.]|jgi:hypothetical protein|nr:hypothetical protein [Dactylosporangium sp.]
MLNQSRGTYVILTPSPYIILVAEGGTEARMSRVDWTDDNRMMVDEVDRYPTLAEAIAAGEKLTERADARRGI